ncbi:lachrymatory-factor synthase-like [Phalaenopsis equestris]|uniref:lachrymatory-factor synthase-like n=1 Tax=Phalaenopsis equestris TaxID=78828 RepID=UPI0009E59988|nr:lachrymatory-factor synthase-like [Phalaenopsis equestris]
MESKKWAKTMAACFPAATVEEAWAIAGDFCGVHKWLPLDTCYKLEGEENKPGCVRFCSEGRNWAKERLVSFDPVDRCYSYVVTESNMGFGDYLATIKVVPAGEQGCKIEWSFEADPVEGWTEDGFVSFMQTAFETLGNAIHAKEN